MFWHGFPSYTASQPEENPDVIQSEKIGSTCILEIYINTCDFSGQLLFLRCNIKKKRQIYYVGSLQIYFLEK